MARHLSTALTEQATWGYHDQVSSDTIFETLRELIGASNPGLVMRADLERLEARLDELLDLVDAIEERLQGGSGAEDD